MGVGARPPSPSVGRSLGMAEDTAAGLAVAAATLQREESFRTALRCAGEGAGDSGVGGLKGETGG